MATILLIVIYAAFIGLGIPDSLFGAAWPAIYPDLGVSLSLASLYSVITSFAGMISSLLSGRVIAKLGTERVAALSTVLTALGLLAFSFGGNLWVLCLCAVPLGLGAGAVDTALNNYVALHYSATQMNFLHCFYGVGVSISPYLLSFALASANNWRGGYRMMFCIQSGIAILLILTLPLWKMVERRSAEPEVQTRAVPLREVWRNPVARASAAVFLGSCTLESVCLAWGSTWLVSSRGLEPYRAAELITWYYVGMSLGRFLSGIAAKWLRPKQVLAAGEILAGVAVVILFVPHWAVAGVGLFLVGLGNGPVFPNMTYLTPIHFGQEVSQSVIGLQMAVANGAFMLAPLLFSLIAQTLGVGLFPAVCLVAFLLTAGATVLMVRRTGKEIHD